MKKALQIDERDNVATMTSDAEGGEAVEVISPGGEVLCTPETLEEVPFGHKIALEPLGKGDAIVKYGEVIGVASRPIKAGEWVHTHNVESARLPTRGQGEWVL